MRLIENRGIAWAVLAACVLLSVFGLGGAALGRERAQALKVFNEGVNPRDHYSMNGYLKDVDKYAKIIASETRIALGGSALVDSAIANASIVGEESADLDSRYRAFAELVNQVNEMFDMMTTAADGGTIRLSNDFSRAFNNFTEQVGIIKKDGYHKQAESYNDLISGFPAGVIAGVTGQSALNTFGG